jgi:hypothetical protein
MLRNYRKKIYEKSIQLKINENFSLYYVFFQSDLVITTPSYHIKDENRRHIEVGDVEKKRVKDLFEMIPFDQSPDIKLIVRKK